MHRGPGGCGVSEANEFWLKRSDETDYAYQAFCVYRDLGPGRRLRKAASIFYGREDVGAEEHQVVQLRRWSAAHLWTSRAEAHDAEQSALLAAETRKRRIEMADNHHRLARIVLHACAMKAQTWLRNPDEIPAGQVAQLIAVATNVERLALGEPSEITEARDPDQRQRDFSALTDAEIDQLYELGRKLGEIDE
jgi:hypothetical protein